MNKDNSQEVANPTEFYRSEFDTPPVDPIKLFKKWLTEAEASGVKEPDILALSTVDQTGRTSTRCVQIFQITAIGAVFLTKDYSQKGRDIATNKWASGALFWRETRQQLTLAGPVEQLSSADSDALWEACPASAHPMTVASKQGALLEDEQVLRSEAQRLAQVGEPLARPIAWGGYHLVPDMVEFWQESSDRLHRRLRYDRIDGVWTSRRLQP